MSARRAPLAWSTFALTLAAYVATIVFDSLAANSAGLGFTAVVSAWLAYAAMGALIATRRAQNSVGWILLAMGASGVVLGFADALGEFGTARPGLVPGGAQEWVLGLLVNLWVVSFALVGVLVLLFPTGRPPTPRWTPYLWITGVLIFVGLLTSGSTAGSLGTEESVAGFPLIPTLFSPDVAAFLTDAGQSLVGIGLMVLAAVAAVSMVIRFRRSAGIERQQLKWFAFAASIFVTVYVVTALAFFIPEIHALDPEVRIPVAMFGGIPFILALVLLPASVGIAILRYRLYDIDVLINRALVYGALSAALAAAYAGSVILLQSVLRAFTAENEIAVAISTLAVVALFQPLRGRIQDFADRRFYRSRYNAARTLDAFAARLRGDVDLDSVRSDLLSVLNETVRPSQASVWLRKTGSPGSPAAVAISPGGR